MKATELRIKNFIKQGAKEYILDHNSLIDILDYDKVYHEVLFQPIPLTEEWLLKFDFHELEDGNLRNGMLIVTKNSKGELTITIRLIMIKSIKYVHQLQNLYFALTGTELTIK